MGAAATTVGLGIGLAAFGGIGAFKAIDRYNEEHPSPGRTSIGEISKPALITAGTVAVFGALIGAEMRGVSADVGVGILMGSMAGFLGTLAAQSVGYQLGQWQKN